MKDAENSARGLVLRLLSPTVIAGAGLAVASTGLSAEYVDAAGVSHPVQVRKPDGDAGEGGDGSAGDGSADGGHFESGSVSTHQTTVLDGGGGTASLETTFGPERTEHEGTDTGEPGGNIFQSQQGGVPPNLGDDILVEFDQHIVVHELANGKFAVESVITITVHRDGHQEVFTETQKTVVTKEHADTDLVIQQDGDVTIRIDDNGEVHVDMDGDLSVTEQPGDPHDAVPEGAVVVVQDQDLTVIDEDDGDADDLDDPDVFGHFDQIADTEDHPGDGEVDVFVIDQNQTKTETEVQTGTGVNTGVRGPVHTPASAPATAPITPDLMVQATAQTYVAPPPGMDPAFGAAPDLPDATGLLDTPLTPVVRDSLPAEPDPLDPEAGQVPGTEGHFDPPQVDPPFEPSTEDPDIDPVTGESTSDLGDPDGTESTPDGTSDLGDVTGFAFDADPSGTDSFDPTPTAGSHDQVDPQPTHLDAAPL